MILLKIASIGIIGTILFNLIKTVNNEFSICILIVAGAIVMELSLGLLGQVKDELSVFSTAFDSSLINNVVKIIGIGYVAEFSSSISRDMGCESIANKVELGGKVIIFAISFPILKSIFELLQNVI